jgi:arginine N-succinyltransferase
MLVVRPVRSHDHAELLALAKLAGIGMTSLPPDSHVLEQKIQRAVASFQGKPEYERGESFLFVLEDDESGRLIGTTGIVAHVGLRRPFYSYKLSTIVQASRDVNIYSLQKVLHMVNDYTGASEIGSLFLSPDFRKDGLGRFLSRCRYLVIAEFPHLFDTRVISEIRGVQDAEGESPFYNNLARHFFQMDFKEADFIHATQGGQFIADLMPKYPIYVNLLPASAQAVIGEPFAASKPAKGLLEKEGFTNQGYVDVFDAGPTMQADAASIHTVAHSRSMLVSGVKKQISGDHWMIANSVFSDFRMVHAPLECLEDSVVISEDAARALRVQSGDKVRVVL